MTRPPVLSQKTLDLYRLYQLVQEYGGMEKVRLTCVFMYPCIEVLGITANVGL